MPDDVTPKRRTRRSDSTPPETAQEAPPRQEKPPEVKPPGKVPVQLQRKLETLIAGCALPFAAAGDTYCASILAARAPVVAEAWANLAGESPAVKRALESMLKGGAWGAAIGTTVVTVVPIAAHHGVRIPDPVTPILFGRKRDNHGHTSQEEHTSQEPVFMHPDNVGNGVPGPAAYSVPTAANTDMTDPSQYAGNVDPEADAA